jgi:zinc protease
MITIASVNAISLNDLKEYYSKNISPNLASFQVVGAISKEEVNKSLIALDSKWTPKSVEFPKIADPIAPDSSKVYFYDVPGAKQSVLRVGYPALAATDADYYPSVLLN